VVLTISNKSWKHWVAAGFGSGWLPKAPGTWGSLASLFPAWLILETAGATGLLFASVAVLCIGCWICACVLPTLANKDPGWIVIDEWAGQWLCLALLVPFSGHNMLTVVLAFIAFRVFDIIKPWPISWAERTGAPWWSIMADDMLAGLMGAGVVIVGLQYL